MTFDQALQHYKTQRAIADALGVSRARVTQWKTEGGFSYPQQCVLEKDSGGVLIAKREDDPKSQPAAA